MDYYYKRRR